MDTFFGRYKNPLVLAIALVAQFFLLAVQVRRPFPAATAKVDQEGVRALRYGVASVITPPESMLHKSGLSVRNVWSSYLDLIGVHEQNVQLKQEIDRLRLEQASLAEDARQGERLQDLLAFRQNYINSTVPAQVVGTSGTDRSHVLLLDKGSDDGIADDMPVITPDGIVGRIREVYPHSAQVLEISDPASAAGVLLEETRTRGILRGSPQGQPQIVNLMPDERIKPGQVVLTSGGDQVFPRGLPVGVVDHIAPDPDNEPMVDVVLKPAANLGRLEEVLVVTGTGPAPTERARRDVSKSELIVGADRAAKELEAQAAVDNSQRASDVLAQRLPSRYDQADLYAPDASADASPATTEAEAKPLHPPSALHPDHYTPGDVPAADSLTPGQRLGPLAEGNGATERRGAKTEGGVNATDTAPVGTNPAFASAGAAMTAERKAAAEAKAAEAARRYAAMHPGIPAASTPAGEEAAAPGATRVEEKSAGAAVLYARRVNEDGTTAWVPVPGAIANPAAPVQFVTRTNADGTIVHVPVPGITGPSAKVLYMARTNADGTVSHVPVTASVGSAPDVRYVNRTNADGTVTRIAVPNTADAAIHYTTRVNADGTTTRVAVPGTGAAAASGTGTSALTASVRYVNRTNADGTVTRVAVPSTPVIQYTTRTNADGTVTRVPVPAAIHYTTRVNADGTTTRVPVPSTSASATPGFHFINRTNADGTVTRVAVPNAPASPAGAPAKPKAAAPAVTPKVVTDGPLASGRTHKPELVPDDGSRPPAAQPSKPSAPQSTPAPVPPQEQH
jgi:rod shape-determining protein MreC